MNLDSHESPDNPHFPGPRVCDPQQFKIDQPLRTKPDLVDGNSALRLPQSAPNYPLPAVINLDSASFPLPAPKHLHASTPPHPGTRLPASIGGQNTIRACPSRPDQFQTSRLENPLRDQPTIKMSK